MGEKAMEKEHLNDIQLEESEILKLVKERDARKAMGLDVEAAWVLKECAEQL